MRQQYQQCVSLQNYREINGGKKISLFFQNKLHFLVKIHLFFLQKSLLTFCFQSSHFLFGLLAVNSQNSIIQNKQGSQISLTGQKNFNELQDLNEELQMEWHDSPVASDQND